MKTVMGICIIAGLSVVLVLAAPAARADGAADELIATLKIVAADKTEGVDIRLEALATLRAMGVEDAAFFSNIAKDKGNDDSLRAEALKNYLLCVSSGDAREILSAILLDNSESKIMRLAVIEIAKTQGGVVSYDLRDALLAASRDSGCEISVRIAAIQVLVQDPDSDCVEDLVAVTGNLTRAACTFEMVVESEDKTFTVVQKNKMKLLHREIIDNEKWQPGIGAFAHALSDISEKALRNTASSPSMQYIMAFAHKNPASPCGKAVQRIVEA